MGLKEWIQKASFDTSVAIFYTLIDSACLNHSNPLGLKEWIQKASVCTFVFNEANLGGANNRNELFK